MSCSERNKHHTGTHQDQKELQKGEGSLRNTYESFKEEVRLGNWQEFTYGGVSSLGHLDDKNPAVWLNQRERK